MSRWPHCAKQPSPDVPFISNKYKNQTVHSSLPVNLPNTPLRRDRSSLRLRDFLCGHRQSLGRSSRELGLLFPDGDNVRVVPELQPGVLLRSDERETRGTTVAVSALEEVFGAGDTGDSDRAVRTRDDVLKVLGLGDHRRVGERLKGQAGKSDEGVLLILISG